MSRYLLAGLCLALGFVVSMVFQGVAPAESPCGGRCCTPGNVSACGTSTAAQSAETTAPSHFVHFVLDDLRCKTEDDLGFQIKRIEFQYKGEGIIDSHIVQLAALAAKPDKNSEDFKKFLSILQGFAASSASEERSAEPADGPAPPFPPPPPGSILRKAR